MDSTNAYKKFVVEEPTSLIEGVIFLSSRREQILVEELEVPSEVEEETLSEVPLVEEPEEEIENPIVEPYISFEESTMVGEREGEVHNVDGGEFRFCGGRVKGGYRGGGEGTVKGWNRGGGGG